MLRGRALRGFYTLFYDWSTWKLSTPWNSRCRHHTYSKSRPEIGSSVGWRCERRPYSPSQGRKEAEAGVPDTSRQVEPPLSSNLRKIMRKMPHSVVVATASNPSPSCGTRSSFKGMTVSSFTTLTMTPSPVVTFNIRKPSQTLTAISTSKQFSIHILSATEAGAAIADAFTKGNGVGLNGFLDKASPMIRKGNDRSTDGMDPPFLSAEGVSKVLRCELLEDKGLLEVGDHVLILGKVVDIVEPSIEHISRGAEGMGLCYLDRAYRAVGTVIKL